MRKYVKLITFTVAVTAILASLAIVNGVRAGQYSRELQNNYIRAVNGLAESVCAIDIELHKCICAGTAAGFAESAAEVWAHSQRGKIHAGELPAANGELDGVERFLAQAGDYAISAAYGESLNAEQYDQLIALSEYAGSLRVALEDIICDVNDTGSWEDEWIQLRESSNSVLAGSEEIPVGSGLSAADEALKDYPSLIYDGPYSDHIFERNPALIENSDEVSEEQALVAARRLSGQTMYHAGESEGTLAEYIFSSSDKTTEIAVTRRGGVVSYMMRDVNIGEARFGIEEAERAAETFLKNIGMKEFVRIQYNTYGGMCVFSFAPQQDNIVLYPDQVKVSVALDCGDVVAYDARDYIMNHAERGVLAADKTRLQAEAVVSDMLTVTDSRLVLIQSGGLEEHLCYEFICRRWDGGEAAVYINADTLSEERIFLLSRTADSFTAV